LKMTANFIAGEKSTPIQKGCKQEKLIISEASWKESDYEDSIKTSKDQLIHNEKEPREKCDKYARQKNTLPQQLRKTKSPSYLHR